MQYVSLTLTIPSNLLGALGALLGEHVESNYPPIASTTLPDASAPTEETYENDEPAAGAKRGRGRPKGSTKAKKAAEAEAEAAANDDPLGLNDVPDDVEVVTEDQVKAAIHSRIETHGLDSVKQILAAAGAAKFSDLDPSIYGKVLAKLKAA